MDLNKERSEILREISDLEKDFNRLFLADVQVSIETRREETPRLMPEHRRANVGFDVYRKKVFQQNPNKAYRLGIELHSRPPKTLEEWENAKVYYDASGTPFLNSVGLSLIYSAGWSSEHFIELSGVNANAALRTLERASKWCESRRDWIQKLFFPDQWISVIQFGWPDLLLIGGEHLNIRSIKRPVWNIELGQIEVHEESGPNRLRIWTSGQLIKMQMEVWKSRKENPFFTDISQEDEERIGDCPQDYFCNRDDVLADSERLLSWIREQVEQSSDRRSKRTKAGGKPGRPAKEKICEDKEEQKVWSLHRNQGLSAAEIASRLSMSAEMAQTIINRCVRREKRIGKRNPESR